MFVISFNICLFIHFSVKYAIQSNDCDVFVNKQSIYLSIYLFSQKPFCHFSPGAKSIPLMIADKSVKELLEKDTFTKVFFGEPFY